MNGSISLRANQRKVGEAGMTYKRGHVIISVEQIDGFGKNPGLWIGTDYPNHLLKVASFGSEDKAKLFCKWLTYVVGVSNDEEAVKWE